MDVSATRWSVNSVVAVQPFLPKSPLLARCGIVNIEDKRMPPFGDGHEAVTVFQPIDQHQLVVRGAVLPAIPTRTAHANSASDEDYALICKTSYL
jgi:hypothetical protein